MIFLLHSEVGLSAIWVKFQATTKLAKVLTVDKGFLMISEDQLLPYSASDIPKGPYLVFAPHPDDETLGMGGTISLASRSGIDVYLVIVTDGGKGGEPDVRIEEAKRAALILGIKEVFYLNIPDREVFQFPFPEDTIDDIFAKVSPSTLFLPAFQEIHPDHRAVTHKILLFLDKTAYPVNLWFYEINRHGEITHLIDISPVLTQKEGAIDCYGSQLSQLDYKAHAFCLDKTRSVTLGEASSYAEGFWVYQYGKKRTPEIDYFKSIDQYRISENARMEKDELPIIMDSTVDNPLSFVDRLKIHLVKIGDAFTKCLPLPMQAKNVADKEKDKLLDEAKYRTTHTQFASLDLEGYPLYLVAYADKEQKRHKDAPWYNNNDLLLFQLRANTPVPICANQWVHFYIKSDARNMDCLDLFMATYNRINPGTLVLNIYEDHARQNCLRSSKVCAATVFDNATLSFYFDPIAESENKKFFISLGLEGGVKDRCLGVWISPEFPPVKDEAYQVWQKTKELPYIKSATQMKVGIREFNWRPKIEVVLPLLGSDIAGLEETLLFIKNQIYPEWQLAVVCAEESHDVVQDLLSRYLHNSSINGSLQPPVEHCGIFHNLESAVDSFDGDFILFLNAGDTLPIHALYEAGVILNRFPDTELLYADEDRRTAQGLRTAPFFKPDWSPELLMSCMYMGGFTLYKREMLGRVGGLQKGFEFDFELDFELGLEYDLTLRMSELTNKIYHIPKILYHRGHIDKDCTHVTTTQGFDRGCCRKIIKSALERRGISGDVLDGLTPQSFRVKRSIGEQGHRPLVSIIIPFKDNPEILETCIQSILDQTCYENYEILLINNQSVKEATFTFLEKINSHSNIKILNYDYPFNYAAINNFAVERAKGDVLLFLNSDTKVISKGWIEAMLEYAMCEGVGAVGAKLYYPNDTIQHAGIVLGVGGIAGHAFKSVSRSQALKYYFGFAAMVRDVSAVTGACMMVRKVVYQEMGGFDQVHFKIAYNDVDFCLKLRQSGYGIIYTPFAQLYHYESYSRGYEHEKSIPPESEPLIEKWKDQLKNDPFYNPNLTVAQESWGLSE